MKRNNLYRYLLTGLTMTLSFSACQQEELANDTATGTVSRGTDDKYTVHIDTNEAGAGKLDSLITKQTAADGKINAAIDWLFIEGPINADDLTYLATYKYLDSLNIENTKVMTVPDRWNPEEKETTTLPNFENIQSQMGIALPKGVTNVHCMANGNFRYVKLPDKVVALENFRNCRYLKSIDMPNSVTYLQGNQFENCTALQSVKLSENLDKVAEVAFYGCTSLTSIHLPENIKQIERGAFYGCTNLSDINLSDNITSIGYDAFVNCSSLGHITLPKNLKTIEGSVFDGCSQLATKLPDGIEAIGACAFRGCSSMTSLDIPISVTSIGSSAFAKTGISSVTLTGSTPLAVGMFEGCQRLKTIKIPERTASDTEGSIPENFLHGCTSLETVEIPEQTIGIENGAFSGCLALKEITLPNHLREIGDLAFAETGLQTLTIPSKVKVCGKYIAAGCPNLSTIFWNSDSDVPALVSSKLCNVLIYIDSDRAEVDTNNPNIIVKNMAENIILYDNVKDVRENENDNYFDFDYYNKPYYYNHTIIRNGLADSFYYTDPEGNKIPINYTASFHCSQTFTAKKATYIRDFSNRVFTGWYDEDKEDQRPGRAARWQSIVLPFKPTAIKAKESSSDTGFTKLLAPFDANVPGAKPFWLRELKASGFTDVTELEANKPYIISMPYSDRYLEEYNIDSEVEFSAENVTFEATGTLQPSEGPEYTLYPTYGWLEQDEEFLSINMKPFEHEDQYYAPGSVFVSNRDIRPFEAYIRKAGTRSIVSISPKADTRSARVQGPIPAKEDAD